MEIDSRPSDAIALAVRAKVPIYADESGPRQGWRHARQGRRGHRQGASAPKVDPEELETMSAFKDFIESLDLDDFDKRKS